MHELMDMITRIEREQVFLMLKNKSHTLYPCNVFKQNHAIPHHDSKMIAKLKGTHKTTVSHFSYAPLFQGPHFLTKMLEPNILYHNLFINTLSI